MVLPDPIAKGGKGDFWERVLGPQAELVKDLLSFLDRII